MPSIWLKLFPVFKDCLFLLSPIHTQNTIVCTADEMQEDIYQEENI